MAVVLPIQDVALVHWYVCILIFDAETSLLKVGNSIELDTVVASSNPTVVHAVPLRCDLGHCSTTVVVIKLR